MRLTPKAVRAIERGDKTQQRVLVTDPAPRRRRNGTTYISQPFHPTVGQTLAVQPETRDENTGELILEAVRVIVTDVDRGLLGDINLDGAQAEGHPSLAAFADDWMRLHTDSWPPKTEALCKQCDGQTTYIDHAGQTTDCEWCDLGVVQVDDTPDPDTILDRFERKHAHHLVWVVTFALDVDTTLFLNKRQYAPPTRNLGEALDPDAPLLGAPHPDWAHRAEIRRRQALRDRDGARLAGLDRLAADLEAEALRVALESDQDVGALVREIRRKVDRVIDKVSTKGRAA